MWCNVPAGQHFKRTPLWPGVVYLERSKISFLSKTLTTSPQTSLFLSFYTCKPVCSSGTCVSADTCLSFLCHFYYSPHLISFLFCNPWPILPCPWNAPVPPQRCGSGPRALFSLQAARLLWFTKLWCVKHEDATLLSDAAAFFSTDPSFSLCCHLRSAMFTTRSQAIRPPPYLSFTSLLPVNPCIRPSINPSFHHAANINPRPDSPPHLPIPLFLPPTVHPSLTSALIHPCIALIWLK